MAVIVLQTPTQPFDMAYGANPITLSGIQPNEDKYALRIFIVGQTDPIADIRQTPNRIGRAIFDIQNVLQSYIGPQVNTIDSLHIPRFQQNTRISRAEPTLIEYQIATATESGGVVGAFTTLPEIFTVIAGSKQYFQVTFDTNPYQVMAANDENINPGTVIETTAKPQSDNN